MEHPSHKKNVVDVITAGMDFIVQEESLLGQR